MQKVDFKFLIISGLIIFLSLIASPAIGQPTAKLAQADSLFESKRYTQSLELYREILEEKYSSPSMLLKMSFISEGLEHPADALFYLNLYYLKTSDKSVLNKMEELAGENNVSGYQSDSDDFLHSLYTRFSDQILIVLGSLALFSMAVGIYRKRRFNARPYFAVAISTILALLLFYQMNFGSSGNWGIIHDGQSPIMLGPSPGSDLLTIAREGHKVRILGEEDVWMKILWNDNIAFIKKSHIRSLGDYL